MLAFFINSEAKNFCILPDISWLLKSGVAVSTAASPLLGSARTVLPSSSVSVLLPFFSPSVTTSLERLFASIGSVLALHFSMPNKQRTILPDFVDSGTAAMINLFLISIFL